MCFFESKVMVVEENKMSSKRALASQGVPWIDNDLMILLMHLNLVFMFL